jgi:hypothetical protein
MIGNIEPKKVIKQLVACAPGWRTYVAWANYNKDGTTFVEEIPIACWALVQDVQGEMYVEPVVWNGEWMDLLSEDIDFTSNSSGGKIFGPGQEITEKEKDEMAADAEKSYKKYESTRS